MKVIKHFITITRHKNLVMAGCFRLGLYKQGLLHDLSKYSPAEFIVSCKYYQGDKSPNEAERAAKGYSSSWLHHKGRNKHHLDYWVDYALADDKMQHAKLAGMKMPIKYVCEMFVDRVSASKIYQKDNYSDDSALIYFQKGVDNYLIHEDTRALIEYLLTMLAIKGEKYTYSYIKNKVLKNKIPYEKVVLEGLKKELHV